GPVTPGEFGGGVWQEPGDGCFGNVGEGAAGRLSVKPAAEKLYADLEFAVTDPASRKIEHVLVVARTVKQPVELGGELGARWRRIEEAGAQHAVEQSRPARQQIGKPRACGHDLGDDLEQGLIIVKQREELDPRRQPRQELVEADERR